MIKVAVNYFEYKYLRKKQNRFGQKDKPKNCEVLRVTLENNK